jgi:hypothetical protein
MLISNDFHLLVWRAETFPEKLMVQVASTIELDCLGQLGKLLMVALGKSIGCFFLELVVVGDVSDMVLPIVILH